MKKRTGLLLACTLLAALLLSGCSGQKRAEYRADVQSGVSYLQSLETIDPDTVTQKPVSYTHLTLPTIPWV